MARQGPLSGRTARMSVLAILIACGLATRPVRADAPAPAPPPLGARPYAIRAQVHFDPTARVDATLRAVLAEEWLGLVARFVGDPWRLDVLDAIPSVAAVPIESLPADLLKGPASGADKLWAIRVHRAGATFVLEGREFDALTGRLGEVHRVEATDRADLPRGLLRLALALFEPVADVGASRAGGVAFEVQGGAIAAADPVGVVAPVGSVFRAFRLFLDKDGKVAEVLEVPYAYFRVEGRDGATAHCSISKGLSDPLTARYARRNKIVALGIQPARSSTRLRFLLKADRAPAAGYKVLARGTEAEAKLVEVAITDRDGRVELPPDFAAGLAYVRVIGGNDEPLTELPVMPGESRAERTIVFDGRPRTLDLEAKLDALRDAIVDLVASRSRLEARMRARIEGENLDEFDQALAEFRKLPPREQFEDRLNRLKADAEQAEAATKSLVLTRNARNQLDETQALIARYLDDDAVRSMVEAVANARAERAADAAKDPKWKKAK